MSEISAFIILLGLAVAVLAISRLPWRGGAGAHRPIRRVGIVLGLLAAGLGTAVATGALR
jgi:hypothetical protein